MGPQNLTHHGKETRGHGGEQRQHNQAAETPDPAERHGLVTSPLHKIFLAGENDKDGAIIGHGEEDAGDRVEHGVARDHAQKEEGHPLRAKYRRQRTTQEQQKSRHVVDM